MKVAAVEAVPYALPFREPYVTARGRLERREMALVRLRTDEGVEGLGEAVAMSLRGGAGAASLAREVLDVAGPALVGLDVPADLPPGLRGGLPNVPGLTGLSGKPMLPGLGGFPGKKK